MDMYMGGQHASLLTGPMLFGYVLDALLFGVFSMQTYIYFLAFPNDNLILKSTVYGVYSTGTLQTIFALRDLYFLACTGPNSGDRLYTTPGDFHQYRSTWFNIYLTTALVAFVVQWLYAYRIYLTSKNIPIVGTVLALSFVQLSIGIWGSVAVIRMSPLARFEPWEEEAADAGYAACTVVWGCINAACGFIITAYMVSYYRQGLSGSTQSRLTRAIQFAVETSLLTTAVMVVYAVASIRRNPPLYMLTGLVLGKLYSSSMMVMLNGRLTIKGGRNIGSSTTFDTPPEFSKRRTRASRARAGSMVTKNSVKTDLEAGAFGVNSRFRNWKSLDSDVTEADIDTWDNLKNETWIRPPPLEEIDLVSYSAANRR